VGDMDSIPASLLMRYHDAGVETHLHPPRKDATDLELALEMALGQGATRISILGGPAAGWTTPWATSSCCPVACPPAYRPVSWTRASACTSWTDP
jgi:hypothetical protein